MGQIHQDGTPVPSASGVVSRLSYGWISIYSLVVALVFLFLLPLVAPQCLRGPVRLLMAAARFFAGSTGNMKLRWSTEKDDKYIQSYHNIKGRIMTTAKSVASSASSLKSRWTSEESVKAYRRIRRLLPNRRRLTMIVVGVVIVAIAAVALGLGLHFGLKKGHVLNDGPEIDLGYSRYRGNYLKNNVSEYLGMRYASPPIDDLRWRAPTAPNTTEELQGAQEFKPMCPAVGSQLDDESDEDCLFVNVWAPTNATADMKLPVMVFIQGGGYTMLSDPWVNGTQLVTTSNFNMVVVSFNYRVGLFGFLASSEVKRDGDLNVGLLDQRFLLYWVQKHISEFGGDPDHVVIQGVSAGAGSVALQLVANGGRDDGLFVGAIAESVFLPGQSDVTDLEYQFDRIVSDAGCEGNEEVMGCLRNKTKTDLQAINHGRPFEGRRNDPRFYWAPCTDGTFLRDLPLNLYNNKSFVNVPILFGSCTNEGSIFAPNISTQSQFATFMQNQYPDLSPQGLRDMLRAYPEEERLADWNAWYPSASRAYGEATFICPTNYIVQAFASTQPANESTVWSYRYNLTDNGIVSRGRGTPHVMEVPAVFGPSMVTASAASYFRYNRPMVPMVQNYWISFVRALNPNKYRQAKSPYWDPWGKDEQRLLLQLKNSTMEQVPKDERGRCGMWSSLNHVMRQ